MLLAVAHELQQEHEQVDEVEVQLQRAHDGRLAQPLAVTGLRVLQIRMVSVADLLPALIFAPVITLVLATTLGQ